MVAAVLFALPATASADLVYLMAPSPLEVDDPAGPSWTVVGHAYDSARECVRAYEARVATAEAAVTQAYADADLALLDRADAFLSASPEAKVAMLRLDADLRRLVSVSGYRTHVRRWRCVSANDPRLR